MERVRLEEWKEGGNKEGILRGNNGEVGKK